MEYDAIGNAVTTGRVEHHDENYLRLFAPALMVDHLPRAGPAGVRLQLNDSLTTTEM